MPSCAARSLAPAPARARKGPGLTARAAQRRLGTMTSSSAAAAAGHGLPTEAFETLAIHAGQHPDPVHGAVMQPIVLSSTFAQPEPGRPLRYDYSRSGNP